MKKEQYISFLCLVVKMPSSGMVFFYVLTHLVHLVLSINDSLGLHGLCPIYLFFQHFSRKMWLYRPMCLVLSS